MENFEIYSMNSKFTKDYLRDHIAVLKDNEVYRINDGMRFNDSHKVIKALKADDKYKETILRKYVDTRNSNEKDKHATMFNIVNQQKNNTPKYDDRYLVVHIRAGDDYKKLGLGSEKVIEDIQKNIDEYIDKHKSIQEILIVTALHYGCANDNGIYSSKKFAYTSDNHDENIDKIYEFISNQKLPVILQSSTNVDEDFMILCMCKYLITSGGGFSRLIKKMNTMSND